MNERERLLQIADEIEGTVRQWSALPYEKVGRTHVPHEVWEQCGRLIVEARDLGAFESSEFAVLRSEIQKHETMGDRGRNFGWLGSIYGESICQLAPDVLKEIGGVVRRDNIQRFKINGASPVAEQIRLIAQQIPDGDPKVSGYLGGVELRDALGIPESQAPAFETQLSRKRKDLGDSNWKEVVEPGPHQPKYLYKCDAAPLLKLAEPYKKPKPVQED